MKTDELTGKQRAALKVLLKELGHQPSGIRTDKLASVLVGNKVYDPGENDAATHHASETVKKFVNADDIPIERSGRKLVRTDVSGGD